MTLFPLLLLAFALLHLPALRRWPGGPRSADKAAGALGLILILPGVLHLTRSERFEAMVPPALPWPEALVLASGVAELLLAAGLLLPATRRLAGWGAVALLLAVWPANVWVAWSGRYPEGLPQSAVYHALRVPFQLLYLGWAAWAALGHLPGQGLRRRMFARWYDKAQARYDEHMAARRRSLLADLEGSVLELGPGTGANLPHLPAGVRWIGAEPNPWMREELSRKAAALGREVEFCSVDGSRLERDDASVDAVLSTLVLCSVPDPDATLREIHRVLKPGGRYLFVEHVAAPRGTGLRRLQRALRPVWRFLADNCHPDRELGEAVRRAPFAEVELEDFRVPREASLPLVSPHVAGVAVKQPADRSQRPPAER